MERFDFIVNKDEEGVRIDKTLAAKLEAEYSRTYIKNMIDKGLLTVNDRSVKANYIPKEGDAVVLEIEPPEKILMEAENIPINVMYEDESVIVINKPAGLVVHPGCGNKKSTLVNALLYHCDDLADTGDEIRPGIVHRLDKDTSGILVVAKNDKALRSLSKQFQKRTVKKIYAALVQGIVEFDNGIIDAPLARSTVNRQVMDIDIQKGKEARTIYHVVRRFNSFTLLRLELETGRTHQIRVHLKHLGHPVIGDRTYSTDASMERQALHAEKIEFTHPKTRERMKFYAPFPEDMIKFIRDRISDH